VKWNGWSLFFAIILFIPTEMTVNIERIIRITGLSYRMFYILDILLVILCIILFFKSICLMQEAMVRSRLTWALCLSWALYFVLMVYAMSRWFPVTRPADFPSPVLGLLLIGVLIIYPFCIIALISFLKEKAKSDEMSSLK